MSVVMVMGSLGRWVWLWYSFSDGSLVPKDGTHGIKHDGTDLRGGVG